MYTKENQTENLQEYLDFIDDNTEMFYTMKLEQLEADQRTTLVE